MREVRRKWLWSGSAVAMLVIAFFAWMTMRKDQVPEIQKTLIYDFSVKNPMSRVVHKADVWISIPVKDDKTEIVQLDSSHIYKIESDNQGNQRVVISLTEIAPYATESIFLNVKLLARQGPSQNRPGNIQKFLASSRLIESDDENIIALAEQLKKDEPYQTVDSIYEWVASNIRYAGFIKNDHGARYALEQRRGDCTEYAYLSTALARAVGLPARAVGGFLLGKGFKLDSSAYHNWSEIWVDGRWILVDPQNRVFDKEYDRYIVMNQLDGDRRSQQFFGVNAPLVVEMN